MIRALLARLFQLDRTKMLIILAACALLIVADIALGIGMQVRRVGEVGKQAAQTRKEIKELGSKLDDMKKNVEQSRKKLHSKKVISESELPALIQYVTGLASDHAIKLMQINTEKAAATQETKKKSSKKQDSQAASSMAVVLRFDLMATYHQLGSFIGRLESSEYVIFVDELRIVRDTNDPLKEKVSLVLKTYVKK